LIGLRSCGGGGAVDGAFPATGAEMHYTLPVVKRARPTRATSTRRESHIEPPHHVTAWRPRYAANAAGPFTK